MKKLYITLAALFFIHVSEIKYNIYKWISRWFEKGEL